MRLYYCTILNQKDQLLFFIYQSDQVFFAWKHFQFYNHDFEMLLRVAEPNLQIFILTAGFSWRQF